MRTRYRIATALFALATLRSFAAGPADDAVARVPLVSDEAAPPAVADVFALIRANGDKPLAMHRAVANAPEASAAYIGLARTLRRDDHVPRSLRELAILRTLQIENGKYEFQQHSRMARSCGVSAAQIAALEGWRTSGLFSPEQRAVLGWVEGMATEAGPDAASVAAMQRLFDPHGIVEITLTSGFYVMSARTTRALAVKPETPVAGAPAPKC
jgi:alkylhydroperoxidase family enzyme